MAALLKTHSRPSVSAATRSAVADRMLAVNADSTVELPSEPDPGSAGSSSCVSNFSRYMSVRSTFVVLTEMSNFNSTTPHGPSSCDELSGS